MNDESGPLTVFFDYTCPFAYRAAGWLAQLSDVEVGWRPFSLLEHNYRGDGPSVWRLAERADDISLLLFAGHAWVAADDADLDQYRHQVFGRWHEHDGDLEVGDVVALAIQAGATGGEDQLRAHFHDAEADHEIARALGVFGSPTLVFGSGSAVFVKLEQVPPPERARPVLDAVATIAELPSVLEVKRPTPPRNPQAMEVDVS